MARQAGVAEGYWEQLVMMVVMTMTGDHGEMFVGCFCI